MIFVGSTSDSVAEDKIKKGKPSAEVLDLTRGRA